MGNESFKAHDEIIGLLDHIFREAYSLYKNIAPNGWKSSKYVCLLHPTAKQQFEENQKIANQLNKLSKRKKAKNNSDSEREFEQDNIDKIDEYREFLYVLGLSVYDIFSFNHEVIAEDGEIFDMGSFRGTGRFLADYFNTAENNYDYMDFYMGSIWIRERANLLPFYEFIFGRLKEKNCIWKYSFPRMSLIRFPTSEHGDKDKPESYKPEEALTNELKKGEEDMEVQNFQDKLDKAYKEEFENAKYRPLNKVVQAYKNIFGVLPEGHPQKRV